MRSRATMIFDLSMISREFSDFLNVGCPRKIFTLSSCYCELMAPAKPKRTYADEEYLALKSQQLKNHEKERAKSHYETLNGSPLRRHLSDESVLYDLPTLKSDSRKIAKSSENISSSNDEKLYYMSNEIFSCDQENPSLTTKTQTLEHQTTTCNEISAHLKPRSFSTNSGRLKRQKPIQIAKFYVEDAESEVNSKRTEILRRQTRKYEQQEEEFKRNLGVFHFVAWIELRSRPCKDKNENDEEMEPVIASQFPNDLKIEFQYWIDNLPHLCYPDYTSSVPVSAGEFKDQFYVVALTDEYGKRSFSYCCRYFPFSNSDSDSESETMAYPKVLAVISPVQKTQFYQTFLQELVAREKRFGLESAIRFLEKSHRMRFPNSGRLSAIVDDVAISKQLRLKPLPSGICGCEELLENLGAETLVTVFAALLAEKRVLILGSDPPQLYRFVTTLASLLAPLEWPHTLIMIIPDSFVDIALAPTPYLMGARREHLNHPSLKQLFSKDEEYLLILDADLGHTLRNEDSKSLVCHHLPPKLELFLLSSLKELEDCQDK